LINKKRAEDECVIVIIGKAANLIDEVKFVTTYVSNSINGSNLIEIAISASLPIQLRAK